jgi:hypothetical protein
MLLRSAAAVTRAALESAIDSMPWGFVAAARMVVDLARRRHRDTPDRVTPVDIAGVVYLLEDAPFVVLTEAVPEALFGLFGFVPVGRCPAGRQRYGSVLEDPSLLRDERIERWLVPLGEEHLLQAHETLRIRVRVTSLPQEH